MSYYISDIFPYLNKTQQKKLEIQLGIVLKNYQHKQVLKCNIIQVLKNKYIVKLKNILNSNDSHILKQIFLEGGFIETSECRDSIDFPVIEFNGYIHLPLEFYEIMLKDRFFKEKQFLIGILSSFPEKELKYWLIWLEKETQIPSQIKMPIRKNLIRFYTYVLLSPIAISPLYLFNKRILSLHECFHHLLKKPPLSFVYECFSFYQALQKIYYSISDDEMMKVKNIDISLKQLLLLFLSGKLVPNFKNNRIENIVLTKELRDIEISTIKKESFENITYLNKFHSF